MPSENEISKLRREYFRDVLLLCIIIVGFVLLAVYFD